MRGRILLSVLLAALSQSVIARETVYPAEHTFDDPSPEQVAAASLAQLTGDLLYRVDQAAWHASDALFARISAEDHPELRGYVTQVIDDETIAVVFHAEADGVPVEFARYIVKGSTVVSGGMHEDPSAHPLSASLARSVAAKQAALEAGVKAQAQLCNGGQANLLALPPDEQDHIAVYILSPAATPTGYPLGGHYRFLVGPDGRVINGRKFTDGCRDVPVILAPGPMAPDTYEFAHILDPQPHELHYFVGRYTNLALKIATGNVLWVIDGKETGD